MSAAKAEQSDLARVHERLDELVQQVSQIGQSVAVVVSRCVPCQETLRKHEEAIYGNGKDGILRREAAAKARQATLAAVGAAICAAAGAVGAIVGALMR